MQLFKAANRKDSLLTPGVRRRSWSFCYSPRLRCKNWVGNLSLIMLRRSSEVDEFVIETKRKPCLKNHKIIKLIKNRIAFHK